MGPLLFVPYGDNENRRRRIPQRTIKKTPQKRHRIVNGASLPARKIPRGANSPLVPRWRQVRTSGTLCGPAAGAAR
jgi:hypothetical protein